MPTQPSSPTGWVAIASGALDVRASTPFSSDIEILVAPAIPGEAMWVAGAGARLWRRLVHGGPLNTRDDEERSMLHDMETLGIASPDAAHPDRVTRLPEPVLSSPVHELVYAVTARVAAAHGIPCLFIKGPALHHQGLREREHSGDVDVWCHPRHWDALAEALSAWGWHREPDPWRGTSVHHTATMTPPSWGCEIDVHRRIPGLALDDEDAFAIASRWRTVVTYAGVDVAIPRRDTHAVLAAVHAVRPEIGAGARSAAASHSASAMLAAAEGSAERACELGAVPVLRAELAGLLPDEILDAHAGGRPRDWQWRGARNRAVAYWRALGEEPWLVRLRVLWRFVWPPDDIALASARQAADASTNPNIVRWRRLLRGARGLLPHRR
ncbi:nucleotidyltransferase family protein [Microbacterium proteolyticum]|uniref:nucleotidyltransferase family protein n=1 Tax=Microbacterium proteolyticum TaxID=1572644 RepID=UPI0035BF6A32